MLQGGGAIGMRALASKASFWPDKQPWLIILLVIATLFFAGLSGAVVALGSKLLLLPILAMLGLVMVLVMPPTSILWLMFIALFVVLGPAVYFAGFTQVQWLPPLMGAVFLIHVFIHSIRGQARGTRRTTPGFVYLLVFFLLSVTFATVIDEPTLEEAINASRFYLFMWPVMLVFMLGIVKPDTTERLWKALLVVAVLQAPVVFYQYFFVARQSARAFMTWDAVVGTFPGSAEGGGQSAAMGTMLLIVMVAAIALWQRHKLHGFWAGLVVTAGIGALALAEVKAVVLLLPIVVALFYRREMMRKPVESLLALIAAGALVATLFVGYEHFHYSSAPSNPNQPTSTGERILRALDPDNRSEMLHEIGRVTHQVFWWDVNVGKGDLHHTLFGYGAGATQVSNLGAGEIARRFPYAMDVSSTNILLWETGVIGHLVFIGLLLSAARLSGRLSRHPSIPDVHQVLLRVGAIGLLILAITLPYKSFVMRSIPIQFLFMLMLGQAGYWARMATDAMGKGVAPAQRPA